MPDLRRLEYFLTVARERNFTRAAEQLHVAQPALSRQVRLLEQELGVALLHRTTHEFELTDAGSFSSSADRHCSPRARSSGVASGALPPANAGS